MGRAALASDVGIGSGGDDEWKENLEAARRDSALLSKSDCVQKKVDSCGKPELSWIREYTVGVQYMCSFAPQQTSQHSTNVPTVRGKSINIQHQQLQTPQSTFSPVLIAVRSVEGGSHTLRITLCTAICDKSHYRIASYRIATTVSHCTVLAVVPPHKSTCDARIDGNNAPSDLTASNDAVRSRGFFCVPSGSL